MYTLLIALVAGLVVGLGWGFSGLWGPWILGITFGVLGFVIVFAILSRRLLKRIQPRLLEVQKLAQANQVDRAIDVLESLLAYGKWQLLLHGQISSQIGILTFQDGKEQKAFEYLSRGTPRLPEGQLMLAAIHFRNGELDPAKQALEIGVRFNKRYVLLHNFLAYIHHKEGNTSEALRVLNRALKHEKGNEATQNNISRLQNGQRLDMKQFGMPWYVLKIEKPPASMGIMSGRKGFRQPPGNRQKGSRPKRGRRR